MKLLEPIERIVAQILPNFSATIIGPIFSPRRPGPMIVIEINPTLVVFAPAIVLPEIKIVGAEMIIDHIENDPDALLVRRIDHALERLRSAVTRLDGEGIGQAVAPRSLAGKRHRRHDFNRVNAQAF